MSTKKTTKRKCGSKKSKVGFAATLVGAAATGYYLFGPKAEPTRKKIKAWTLKAKGEVLEHFEKRKEVTEEQYKEIVDKVTNKYGRLKTVGEAEAMKLNRELKRHWRAIKSGVEDKTAKKKKTK